MATVQYGSIVTNIRGSIGGHTYQKCGNQFCVKTKSSSPGPISTPGVESKMQFAQLASSWSQLSESDKSTFYTYASTYPTYDKYGVLQTLKGYALFQYINRKILLAGGDVIPSIGAYASPGYVGTTISDVDVSQSSYNVAVSSPIPANCYLLLYFGRPFPSSSQRVDWMTYFAVALDENSVFPYNAFSFLNSKYAGLLKDNYRVFWRAFLINAATGASTIDWEMFSAIVT